MATLHLTNNAIDFTNDGITVNVSLIATAPDILSLFSTNGAQNTVILENARSIELVGTTSGNGLTHQAATTTNTYTLTWPAAQAVGTQVLENNGSGTLSWATITPGTSAGNLGDIQYSDGAGGFLASTTALFNYTDGTTSILDVGVNNGTFQIIGANGTTDGGTNIQVFAGDGGSGNVNGGSVSLSAGDQVVGTGNAGSIDFLAGSTTASGSSLSVGGGTSTALGGTILLGGGNTPASATVGAQLSVRGGLAASGGSLDFVAGDGNAAGPGGNLNFTCGDGTLPGEYIFNPAGNTGGPAIVSIQGVSEPATSDTTGTVRITDGLGVTGTVWADELTTDSDLNMNGATSGTLTMHAAASTTSYTLIWPAAQAAGTQVLENNGSGTLSWSTITPGTSAGNLGDIQYSDGAGGFLASTTALFNYTDGTTSILEVGVEDGTFELTAASSVTDNGCNINITAGTAGDTAATDAGSITITAGEKTDNTGSAGNISLVAGEKSGGSGGSGGNINLIAGLNAGTGATIAGGISLIAGSAAQGGDIELVAGESTNVANEGGHILLEPASNNSGGDRGFVEVLGPSAGTTNTGLFMVTDSASANLIRVQHIAENATSTTTGTLRVTNGLGVTGTLFANELTSNTDLNLIGSVSGVFSQLAAATTTDYTITWPNVQGGTNTTILNNGSGALSWSSVITGAAGSAGDIQYNNGAGGLAAATNNRLRYTDTINDPVLLVGNQDAIFNMVAVSATTTGDGGAITIQSGDGNDTGTGGLITLQAGTGGLDGGNINIFSGAEGDVAGTSGTITLQTPDTTVGDDSGSILLQVGSATNGVQGNIFLELVTGSTTPGQIVFQGAETAGSNVGFVFQDAASSPCVEILSGTENATTTTTGTVRITGGLGVSQDIYANTMNVTSDVHEKESLQKYDHNKDLQNIVNNFLNLDVYQYKLKSTGKESIGVLAQDLLNLFPNTNGLVTIDPNTNEPVAVNYNALLMIVIIVVQHLIKK